MKKTIISFAAGGKHYSGLDMKYLHPRGVPKRTFPWREPTKHISQAPTPGGTYITRKALGIPCMPPFQYIYPRTFITMFFAAFFYDSFFGFSPLLMPFHKEGIPGRPSHFFFNNNGGIPHHFWQYQDGWSMPNESGAKRWFD